VKLKKTLQKGSIKRKIRFKNVKLKNTAGTRRAWRFEGFRGFGEFAILLLECICYTARALLQQKSTRKDGRLAIWGSANWAITLKVEPESGEKGLFGVYRVQMRQ